MLQSINKQSFSIYYRPGTADESVIAESFENDLFLRFTPEYRIRPHHIIFDIGAHIGCFSLLAASRLTTGKVFAYEPSADTFGVLEKNVTQNAPNRVFPHQLAVAGTNGRTALYHDTRTGNWGHTITRAVSTETEMVNTETLATILEKEKIAHIDFIKFNCEGAEFEILLNTPPEVLANIDCMLILYHGYLEENISRHQLARHLRSNGFRIHWRYRNRDDDSGWMIAFRAGWMEYIFICLRVLPFLVNSAGQWMAKKAGRVLQKLKGN